MKKILIAAAIVAAASLAACGGKESAADNECCAIKSKIENCANPDSLSLYVDQAKAYAEKLVQEGKVEEARKYLDEITPIVQEKAPSLVTTLETVKSALDQIPAAAEATAAAAVDSVQATADASVDSLKAAGEQAVDQAVDAAKQKGAEAVDAAKQKGAEAASKANDAIQKALGK